MTTNWQIEEWAESFPFLLCQISDKGKIIYSNRHFCKTFSISNKELVGKSFSDFIFDNNLNLPWFENRYNSDCVFESKIVVDTNTTWIEWKICRNVKQIDSETSYTAFGWDVTDRKIKEEHLVRDQYFFDLLMNIIPDRIYFKDLDSKYLKINKAAAKRRNVENPEEAVGKTDFDFFTEEHAQSALNDEKKIINTGFVLESKEELETWHGGKKTWASTTKAPYYDSKGNIAGTFGISRDITVSKLAQQALIESEQKLKESNAVKDKFFSIIAHDLRSPFHGLFGLVNILIDDFDQMPANKIKNTLGLINSEMKCLFNLLEDLLEWGRIQRGAIQFNPQRANICKTIRDTAEFVIINANDKKIDVAIDLPTELVLAYDERMISTVIRNLLTNAIKFTKPGGNISISACDENDFVRIFVKDTGVGIQKDNLSKMFKLSEHISTKGTSNESGSGLGLILCKEFVEQHNGQISVDTEVGKGSTFAFTISKTL